MSDVVQAMYRRIPEDISLPQLGDIFLIFSRDWLHGIFATFINTIKITLTILRIIIKNSSVPINERLNDIPEQLLSDPWPVSFSC